jgi:hypothetical protein
MIIVRGNFFLRGDIWFDDEPEEIPNVDVLYYYYQQIPPSILGLEINEEYTRLIDLTKDRDELWKTINRENRYKIRRAAEKDEVIYEFWESVDADLLNNFFNFHAQFTASHGLKKLGRSRLIKYADEGVLNFSRTKSKEGNPLNWHIYYRGRNRVFMLHSASIKHSTNTSYNQMLGRVNRYHRWQDILTFKNLGILFYDLGGWYTNTTDEKLLNINKFKEEFGGKVVRNFNCRQGITLKGKLFLLLRKIGLSLTYPSRHQTDNATVQATHITP